MSSSQGQQGNQNSQGMSMGQNNNQSASQGQNYNQEDALLCQHMLMTEKYVSGTYDTAILNFNAPISVKY